MAILEKDLTRGLDGVNRVTSPSRNGFNLSGAGSGVNAASGSILDSIRTQKITARSGSSSATVTTDGVNASFGNFNVNTRSTPIYRMMDAINQSEGYDRPAQYAIRLNPPRDFSSQVRNPEQPSLFEQLNPFNGGSPEAAITSRIQDGINSALNGLFDVSENRIRVIEMNANNVALPAYSFRMTENRMAGLTHEVPVQRSYENEITITFNVARDMMEKMFFEQWQHAIINRHTHKVQYKKSYETNIEIIAYTANSANYKSGEEERSYVQILQGAYPKFVGQIERGYDMRDTFSTIAITFAYKRAIELRHLNLEEA